MKVFILMLVAIPLSTFANNTRQSKSVRESCSIPGFSAKANRNCRKIFEQKTIPLEAFEYALQVLKNNSDSFMTEKCFDRYGGFEGVFGHYSTPAMRDSGDLISKLDGGIPNKCSFIINDYDQRIATHGGKYKCQTRMYYVDLCRSEPYVVKTASYVGYGTCKRGKGFRNKSGLGTSLLGAHVTGAKLFDFQKRDAQYSKIAKELRALQPKDLEQRNDPSGFVPALPLFGLQKSNNGSAPDLKYLHVGAYTSAGCPSIPKQHAKLIVDLAKRGPSLLLNYKKGSMESLTQCE